MVFKVAVLYVHFARDRLPDKTYIFLYEILLCIFVSGYVYIILLPRSLTD